jgi:MFS family permease
MFRDAALTAGLAMSVLVSTVMMATLVVGPFYLGRALGLDTARVGLVMSVGSLVAAFTGVTAGRIVDRFGADRMTILGLAGMSMGLLGLSTAPGRFGVAGYVAASVLVTANYALFQAANNTSIMTGVRPDQRGVIAGMLGLSRNLGLITGASLMGAVFAFASGTTNIIAAYPTAIAAGMRTTFVIAALLIVGALAISSTRRARTRRPSLPASVAGVIAMSAWTGVAHGQGSRRATPGSVTRFEATAPATPSMNAPSPVDPDPLSAAG